MLHIEMADKTVRFVAGQFIDPNIDSDKVTANQDQDTGQKSLTNSVVYRQILNQAKNVTVQVTTRKIVRAGNSSQADTINSVLSSIDTGGSIAIGFKTGGIKGGLLAIGGELVRSTLEWDNVLYERAYNDATAMEDARRYGMPIDNRGEFR